MTLSIVPLSGALQPALLEMWRGYQQFYRVGDIDEARNRAHVEHILGNPSLGRIQLALAAGAPVGFSTLYFTFSSTRACRIALLNDLFVAPERRRRGVGRALIDGALELARAEGIRHVRWSTSATNTDAQHLYATYAAPTLWQLYGVDLTPVGS